MCFWCDQIILDLSVAGCKSRISGNAERQQNVSLSLKEKGHSQILRVQNFLFFRGMSLCQVEQRERPQLHAATSISVVALPLSYSTWSAGVISQETQSVWKKNYTVNWSYCIKSASSAFVWRQNRKTECFITASGLGLQLDAGSLTLKLSTSSTPWLQPTDLDTGVT